MNTTYHDLVPPRASDAACQAPGTCADAARLLVLLLELLHHMARREAQVVGDPGRVLAAQRHLHHRRPEQHEQRASIACPARDAGIMAAPIE